MSDKSIVRNNWKLVLNVITITALIVLVYAIRKDIGQTIENLKKVNAWAILLIIPIEIVDYHAQARLYQRLFAAVGNKLKYSYLYALSLELNFVNHVFPSGGVTGISYFSIKVGSKEADVSNAKATLIQLMKLGLTFISFEAILIIGVLSLAAVGRINELSLLVAGILSTLLVVLTVLFAYVVGSKQRINSLFGAVTRWINIVLHRLFKRNRDTINIASARKVFDDFHENYQLIMHWKDLKKPYLYAFLANAAEVMAIYVVFLAFGRAVNIGAVILAYGVANFAGLVSVLPGGIGIYEALMVGVLAIAGVPAAVSLPAIIMYRVINTLIQLPPGFYYYHKSLSRRKVMS